MGFLFVCAPAPIAPRIGFALGALFAIAAALVSALEIRRTRPLPLSWGRAA